ncbi:unnamed protein product [Protopolystoma xenopodis]|uniref:Uncharacterized protein n=1 Tax=Protopolystoma xenopodis TaxID=117903 RepID=A0A448WV51_9PLAT|nr:unnamed protein product [Protopolystoma xenopodis]
MPTPDRPLVPRRASSTRLSRSFGLTGSIDPSRGLFSAGIPCIARITSCNKPSLCAGSDCIIDVHASLSAYSFLSPPVHTLHPPSTPFLSSLPHDPLVPSCNSPFYSTSTIKPHLYPVTMPSSDFPSQSIPIYSFPYDNSSCLCPATVSPFCTSLASSRHGASETIVTTALLTDCPSLLPSQSDNALVSNFNLYFYFIGP